MTQKSRTLLGFDGWILFAGIIAGIVLLPLMAVFYLAFFPSENIWPHLIATSLPRYLGNSLVMMAGVAGLATVFGVSTAWLVSTRKFLGHRYFEWLLLLPLALPGYIAAFAFVDFFEFSGVVQTHLRTLFGWTSSADYWFPQVRSRGAAIWVLSLSLYPYVYLLARAAYREQAGGAFEVARALGCGPLGLFFRVGLPLARPAIVVGVAIAMMETLADFGTVEFFAVQTLTTGIFTVWLEGGNIGGAAQIACVIFLIILGLIGAERISRWNMAVYQSSKNTRKLTKEASSPLQSITAAFWCFIPVFFGFLLPVGIMADHAFHKLEVWSDPILVKAITTTLLVSGSAAIITVAAAIALVYATVFQSRRFLRRILPITTIGYAAPGAVLAIGLMIPLARLDHVVADGILFLTGKDPGLLISGTATIVVLAYCVRFFALAFGTVDAAFGRQSPNLGHAGRSLGLAPLNVLTRLHLPMLKISLLSALLLVLVDCIKELPATLLLRPFGFETLATHVYTFASTEDLARASAGGLLVVGVSSIAVLILARSSK